MKFKAILLVLLAILITKAGNAQYEPQLLKDIEPDAVMTPEQEKLEVVNTLRNVGNGRNVFYVVKERSKPLFGLGQVIDGSFKMRLHLHKQYIDEISNANINDSVSQFVYIYIKGEMNIMFTTYFMRRQSNLTLKVISWNITMNLNLT